MLEHLEHLQARRGDFEADFAKILSFHLALARELIGYDAGPIMTQTPLPLHRDRSASA